MNKTLLLLVASAVLGAAQIASASQDEFCAGFEEGYRSIKGDLVIIPNCPPSPPTPPGSTDFREGIRAGISATQSR